MNVVVCLKQVPATTEVKINSESNTLVRVGIKSIMNPFDSYALEEGVRLKERCGGKVTAISMGPPQAEEMLREAIAAGADEAVLLCDGAFAGADTLATAYTLSRAISKLGQYGLVICGRQTTDGDTGQVGPELAEMLGVRLIAYVSRIEEISDQLIRARRMVEDGYEVIETSLPAVLTVVKEINTPRLPSLRGLARAKKAVVPVWTGKDLEVDVNMVGMVGSATRVTRVFLPQRTRCGEVLKGSPEDQVSNLVARLREAGLV